MRFARIDAGFVAEIIVVDDDREIEHLFHPDIVAASRPCGDEVVTGWVFDGEEFAPRPPPPPTGADLLAYAADARWRREVGGITVSGVPIATDDRSKVMIVGARVAAEADPGWSTIWHGADGQIYPINAAAIIAISAAVEAHVNSGFATFAEVKADIEAGTITTRAEIDAAFA